MKMKYDFATGRSIANDLRPQVVLLVLTMAMCASATRAADWTQFRGPNGSGAATDAETPTIWSDSKNLKPGASATGRGGKPFYASAVFANGHVYAVSRRNGVFVFAAEPEFKLIAHNLLTGDDSDFNATPAISGRQLFLRSNRKLYCIEAMQPAGAGNLN